MTYSKESIDRQKKIADLKNAGVICYANNYHGKINIEKLYDESLEKKEANILMKQGAT